VTDAAALLASDALILTDGGIETRLMFEMGVALPEPLESAALVGTDALREVYASYIAAAREHDLPVILGTPTFRAGARYAEAAGADVVEVNAAAARHHRALRDAAGPGAPVLIAGVLGPYGDAYTPAEAPTPRSRSATTPLRRPPWPTRASTSSSRRPSRPSTRRSAACGR